MASTLGGIGLDVHDVARIEIRQKAGSYADVKWLNIRFLGEDGSCLEITAFCSAGYPTIEQFGLPANETTELVEEGR